MEAGAQAVRDGIRVVPASRATAGRVIATPRNLKLSALFLKFLLYPAHPPGGYPPENLCGREGGTSDLQLGNEALS